MLYREDVSGTKTKRRPQTMCGALMVAPCPIGLGIMDKDCFLKESDGTDWGESS